MSKGVGLYDIPIAEQVVGWLVAVCRGLPGMLEARSEQRWD